MKPLYGYSEEEKSEVILLNFDQKLQPMWFVLSKMPLLFWLNKTSFWDIEQ